MITVMLTLERPSSEQLSHYDRGQKYAALKSSASEIRDRLMKWIDKEGLSQDVARVGEPTAFHTLFVTSTLTAAQQLSRAPGVLGVAPTGDLDVDLFVPEASESPSPAAKALPAEVEEEQEQEEEGEEKQ
jgi:hypothetical protein